MLKNSCERLAEHILQKQEARKTSQGPAEESRRFAGWVLGVTGQGPLEDSLLREGITREGGWIGDYDIWQKDQIIVVGREGFDEEYLKRSIEIGLRFKFKCVYFSQEAFAEWWLDDKPAEYVKGDPRISEHPGLAFLASIGFKWPEWEAVAGTGSGTGSLWLNDTHPLSAVYKYSVRREVPLKMRRAALERAIRPDALGLKAVVEHIAGMVRLNKSRLDTRMDGAIGRWEDDLAWLREYHYKNTIYSFIWPSY
jgi:hypothetical protein